ncbi:MAG: ATP synthase F1 subunit delta [Anaerolineae bacterium]
MKSRKEAIREYASAAFEAAIDGWLKPLSHVANALEGNPDLLPALQNPAASFEERKRVLDGVIPSETQEAVRNFLYVLLEDRQLPRLSEILQEFLRLARPEEAGPVAHVVTAVPLNSEEQAALEGRLRARFGEELRFAYKVDPSILGGVYVQVGDVVIDGSLAGRLGRLRELLASDTD